MSFFLRKPEPVVDEKRAQERRSYGDIMGSFITIKNELIELVKEKTGHVARIDKDNALDRKAFEQKMAMRKIELDNALIEKISAEESIKFIEGFVKTKNKVVAQS